MSTIEIENAGPIERLTLKVPEGGGIVLLRGVNGAGKTKALEAIEKLVSGKGHVSVRDGAIKGQVSGFGATLTVARSTTRRGELEVESLDGRLSIADLVQPPVKDPAAADAKRIKTLVSLAGAEPDPGLFHELVGGKEKFEAMIPLAEADDLVTLASKVKREFESAARKDEDAAQKLHITAEAHREAIGGLDLSKPVDREAAYGELQAATKQHTELTEQERAAREAGEAAEKAREGLAEVEEAYEGPTVEETTKALDAAWRARKESSEARRVAQHLAVEAEVTWQAALKEEVTAQQAAEAASTHATTMQAWRDTLDKEAPASPEASEVVAAANRTKDARAAVSKLAAHEQARQQQKQAIEADAAEATHTEVAERLRDAARGTDDVLSEIVGKLGTPLRVEAGRLVLDTDRGATHFHDLSHGERWRLGLDIAVAVAGDRTIFTIPQEAWEGLDPLNQAAVRRHAVEKGVLIVAAQCSEDEVVTAEVYGEACPACEAADKENS